MNGAVSRSSHPLRQRIVDELRERLLKQGASLPLRNQAALGRVVALCDDRNATAQGVAIEAARDEAFTAALLRVANSAYSGSVVRIGSLTDAVSRLGFGLVQGIAINSMASPGPGFLRDVEDDRADPLTELHRHSIRTGIVARALAPASVNAELALIGGLLHNIGLTIVTLFAPKAFRQVLAAARRGAQLAPIEEEALGFTHAEIGALLAERWAYPPALVLGIHEHDAIQPTSQLAALIQVSDLAVRTIGIGIEPAAPVRPEVARAAGVDLSSIADRLTPLLEAQDRLEAWMQEELSGA
jgi:HD-like signal output (HDOD) protein